MVANAVPAPMLQRIGNVILERHHAIAPTKTRKTAALPKLDKSFAAHLKEQRPHLYRADFKRIQADADRARKIIGDRPHADIAGELKALKGSSVNGVAFRQLPEKQKSALIYALTERRKYEDNQFNAFLERHRPDITDAAVNNVRSNVNRARRMIDGRIYANFAIEIQALEKSIEHGIKFSDMSVRRRSDLTQALSDYRAFIDECWSPSIWAPKPPTPNFRAPPKRRRSKPKGNWLIPDPHGDIRPKRVIKSINSTRSEDLFDGLLDDELFPFDTLPEPRSKVSEDEEWRPDDYWIPDPEELEPED
jgi:hypothetical protein